MHTSLVRPVVKYSAPVLNSYKKQQISQVEQIQRKVATCRYVFDDYCDRSPGSVTNMIDILQWNSLACRWTKTSLILLYQINRGLVEVPIALSPNLESFKSGIYLHSNIWRIPNPPLNTYSKPLYIYANSYFCLLYIKVE
jgi:hypothetical protein